jgi:outer membrane protein assembly factor BamE
MTQLNWSLHRQSKLSLQIAFANTTLNQQLMRKLVVSICALLTLAPLGGCVYQANLSQGNLIKQEDLDQVEVGMTRSQVRFLLGTPMIDDPFHEDRWDYVYFLKIGRDDAVFKRWVSIHFDGDRVVEIVDGQELNPDL